MSASEKLRALEHPAKTQLDVVNNALRLHEAQAQIVAVVEAAEAEERRVRGIGQAASREERKVIECSDVALISWADALAGPLAALEEELS